MGVNGRPTGENGVVYVLLVEDDPAIAEPLVSGFAHHGFLTKHVMTGADAIAAFTSEAFDLVLLDLGLPDMDGVDVCRAIRERDPLLPVVMLTARQEEIDIVVGLDAGAVDYVTKPFRLAELLARVRAQLRRVDTTAEATVTALGDLRLDGSARRVWVADAEVALRAKEHELLVRLVRDAGRVVSREDLMADVWDEHWFGSTKTLDVHIASLRRKLDGTDRAVSRITTIRNVGYRYEVP
jgi:DNA-binding response OmpR family regulator